MLIRTFTLTAPLFALVLAGWLPARWLRVGPAVSRWLTRVVFAVFLPALLFRMMSGIARLPAVDARVPMAFFGGCLVVFAIGRAVGAGLFALDGTQQSVFALGGVFSNNVMLGVPLAQATLGEAAMPSVALVLVFNALTLWTLVTVSVEWAQRGELSLAGFGRTLRGVLTNPIILGIGAGLAVSRVGALPSAVDAALAWVGKAAGPLALVALGMGLAEHRALGQWRESAAITALKLVVQPLVVWALAWLLGLTPLETRVVVLLASLAVGVNVYLMARQFAAMEAAVATSLMVSTALAALTTPLFLALTA